MTNIALDFDIKRRISKHEKNQLRHDVTKS